MKQFTHRLQVATRGKGLYAITREIEQWSGSLGFVSARILEVAPPTALPTGTA